MIRLSATGIGLSRRDLIDYDRRKQKGKENGQILDFDDYPDFGLKFGKPNEDRLEFIEKQYASIRTTGRRQPLHASPRIHQDESDVASQDHHSVSTENLSPRDDPTSSDNGEEQEYIQVSPQNSPEAAEEDSQQGQQQRRSRSPSKDDFHYGGFVESPAALAGDESMRQSSPFQPDDISTPPGLQLPPRRINSRLLPRSPLFISQNASSSPERLPGFALTPRVASRVATHNTPGMMFAQPARRLNQRSPRRHRHQTNSFSFDSTERSSAAYEQERVTSSMTNLSRPSTEDISLRDDLRGSSLQSSRVPSTASEVPQRDVDNSEIAAQDSYSRLIDRSRDFIFSSPHLPLPHPFSSVSRSVSPESQQSPSASPTRSHSTSPVNTNGEPNSNSFSSPATVLRNDMSSSPPSRTRFSPIGLLRQAQRVISGRRVRSPSHRDQDLGDSPATIESRSAASTPRQSQRGHTDIQTSFQASDVYNDSISPATQPQTPAHLPESRHQSRYHPSYTAPVTRAAARRTGIDGDGMNEARMASPAPEQRASRSSWRSFRTRRAASPAGLQQIGFQGLYGGRENGDEEQNWAEGVRFNNAETRLWSTRDARNDDGGRWRETPEPEDFRLGRRS